MPSHDFREPDGRRQPGVGGADHAPPAAGTPTPGAPQTNSDRLIHSLERLGDASVEITSAANSQVERIMGGITKRSGGKSQAKWTETYCTAVNAISQLLNTNVAERDRPDYHGSCRNK
jgi:hypothetical protein